jgi:hypothetical protein
MSKLSLEWTKHLSKEDKEDFEAYIRNSTQIVERLRNILDSYELQTMDSQADEKSYDSPSWEYLQAHRNGKLEMIRRIKKLTDHIVKES